MKLNGRKKQELTIETVLSKISEYDVFMKYMPGRWKLNEVTNSPFRRDRNPSFVVGNKKGNIYFIDYGDTSYRGDCFDFVSKLFNTNGIYDTLKIIDNDFGLGILGKETGEYRRLIKEYKQPEEVKRYSFIQVSTRKFTKEELAYWNEYHIDIEDLRKNNVFSVSKVYLNKQLFPLKDSELRFGYLYGTNWKIYSPFADRKSKWVPNNVPITSMDGLTNIKNCDAAFIQKSKKDFMVMSKIFPCSCAVQNEGIACFSEENVNYLKSNSKKQILSFDADDVGVKNSQQITKLFDFDYCNVPKHLVAKGIKDWADWCKLDGLAPIEEFLKKKQLI